MRRLNERPDECGADSNVGEQCKGPKETLDRAALCMDIQYSGGQHTDIERTSGDDAFLTLDRLVAQGLAYPSNSVDGAGTSSSFGERLWTNGMSQ
jgi:hypothetical protein